MRDHVRDVLVARRSALKLKAEGRRLDRQERPRLVQIMSFGAAARSRAKGLGPEYAELRPKFPA
jgi:hypothetical protein